MDDLAFRSLTIDLLLLSSEIPTNNLQALPSEITEDLLSTLITIGFQRFCLEDSDRWLRPWSSCLSRDPDFRLLLGTLTPRNDVYHLDLYHKRYLSRGKAKCAAFCARVTIFCIQRCSFITYTLSMESFLAPTSTLGISFDDPSIMTLPVEQTKQGKFSKEESNFLKTHLQAYGALCHQL